MPLESSGSLTLWGITVLRVSLGIMFLAHSVVVKWMTFTLPGTAQFFEGVGLPGWLAYVTFGAEALGGLALLLGVQSRWVALALSPILISTVIFVHGDKGWVFTAEGGGWEYPLLLFVLCIVQAMLGDGRLALSPSISLIKLNERTST